MPGLLARGARRIGAVLPAGTGLRHEDWQNRHRLLTWLTVGCGLGLALVAVLRHRLDPEWAVSTLLIAAMSWAALEIRSQRMASSAVAVGLTTACAELVMLYDGRTEAHFSFFVAVGALALYRDWVPFLTFLVATFLHHAVMGTWMPHMVFQHDVRHAWVWAAVHSVAVLLAAATQIAAWRLTEVEERRALEDLTQAEAQFTAAFEEAPIAMTMLGADGFVLRVNPAFVSWSGMPGPLPPRSQLSDLPIQPVDGWESQVHRRILEGETDALREERTFRNSDGALMRVEMHASALRDTAGKLQVIVSHYLDVTEKHQHQEVLRRQAREDALTGLLGRGAFESDLGTLVAEYGGAVSVIYIDVDKFKHVNDSYGHSAGDEVLTTIGARLRAVVPDTAVLARLGGDEFAAAVVGPPGTVEDLAMTVAGCFSEPFVIPGGRRITVTASIGLSLAAASSTGALENADMAMYAAKQSGRARVQLFDDTMREATSARAVAERALRAALDDDLEAWLPVWFQPIVSLHDRRLAGAEALARLKTADGNLVPPGEFIPLAEETGLIVPLGEHVLRTSLNQLVAWGDAVPYISVNVSPRQLAEPGFVPMLTAELTRAGLADPSRLVLEITETTMLERGIDLRDRLDAIKTLGVRLALDDFGTGYSSLTWLQSVPADIVKLDRSFVAGLAHDQDKAAIIAAVLWLARALGMTVVAEGVEDQADAAALASAGCPAAQGWFFGRPVEASAFGVVSAVT
ncbi:putative bifunctional diguanylate cyclase/phosphodiesterase [Kineosporia succinea]|uniref:Diguanylate cyclase (GGDEF)-like protein/PAS domain S-box-containing protein n=1 Tax=Kineosporia succinea TaxID=84632 RepID=A0ABT9P0M1_9ACTN|nr:EAL domain-containing protein [Kineosporia succinea]MDP9826227.1 diguanylate cyclase (GGDEF)-like protein/PAS domain S-box-containing protein [Kineosporia succinea]